jgi:hypothetical protein
MKRRDFIKDSVVSVLAVGPAHLHFRTGHFRQRKMPDLPSADSSLSVMSPMMRCCNLQGNERKESRMHGPYG